ncbi:magnesium chelatase [Babesia caballi]|uniref:Magnesium chelatase n=1 Tax=Babesia caballi TaxID=5871 RepID=A0AAV4LV63_BABCB|nr:magnesium chelatase [Babesia caballi]
MWYPLSTLGEKDRKVLLAGTLRLTELIKRVFGIATEISEGIVNGFACFLVTFEMTVETHWYMTSDSGALTEMCRNGTGDSAVKTGELVGEEGLEWG